MKIGIVIITFNISTRVFILQMEAIKKFCKDEDYTIEIIDNSSNEEMAASIEHHAKDQQVNYRKVESATKDPSLSHSFAANLAYTKLKDSYNILFFLDHDCIPVLGFSCQQILNGKLVAGLLSGHDLSYFWPGCLILSENINKSLVDFSPNNTLRLDTGGELRKLKDKYGDDNCVYFDEIGVQNEYQINHPVYYFYMMIYKKTFTHFLNSSGWNKAAEKNDERISSLIAITTEKINNSVVLLDSK